jgi:hypothetical protein
MKKNQDANGNAECGLGSRKMETNSDPQIRLKAHTERMLARAERRSRQASKLVEKWKSRLADLDREGVAAKQTRLFADDQPADI